MEKERKKERKKEKSKDRTRVGARMGYVPRIAWMVMQLLVLQVRGKKKRKKKKKQTQKKKIGKEAMKRRTHFKFSHLYQDKLGLI